MPAMYFCVFRLCIVLRWYIFVTKCNCDFWVSKLREFEKKLSFIGYSSETVYRLLVEKPVETVNNRVNIYGYPVEITFGRHKIVEKSALFHRLCRIN